MAVLTCKICGGEIIATGESRGICQNCGTGVTLPKINDEVRAEFYNRANHFRADGEFDRAYSEFEHIIAQDPTDAEAYWSLVLCKFGITYARDPHSGQYELLVSNVRQEPVWEDMDYLRALRGSDEQTKALYRAEAAKIDRIQEHFFSLSQREAPYDVFLCVRSVDGDGQLTAAGQVAQTVYEKLSEKNVRVFCEAALPMDTTPQERQAHIAYALSSARIMFVITAGHNDLNGLHIRQQWTRFIAQLEKDRSRKLIPVYTQTQVYELPEQIPTHEAICADQPGYWQDLTWGVQQILGKTVSQPQQSQPGAKEYLEEAEKAFRERNFSVTAMMAEQALNYDPNNAYAHFYTLMAKYKASSFEDLFSKQEDWSTNAALRRIIELDKGTLRDEAQKFHTEYCNRTGYYTAKTLMLQEAYGDAIHHLEKLGDYKDASEVLAQCRKLAHHQKMLRQYQQETQNDPSTHLFFAIDDSYKEEAGTFLEMLGDIAKTPKAKYSPVKALVIMVIMIAIGAYCLIFKPYSAVPGFLFVIVAVMYAMMVQKSKLAAVFLGALSIIALVLFEFEPHDGVEYIVIALYPLLGFLRQSNKKRKYESLVAQMEAYNKEVIIPLEKKIIKDINHRYGDVLTKEEIGDFYPFKTLAIQSIEGIMKEA